MKIRYLIIFMVILFSINSFAIQNNRSIKDTVEAWDNSIVNYRRPSVDTMTYYKQLPGYQYEEAKQTESLFKQFIKWLLSQIRLGDKGLSVLGWTSLAIAVFALLALIIKLLGIPVKGIFVFSKSTQVSKLKFGKGYGSQNGQKLDEMLKLYTNNKAYREATRILFLITLNQLDNKKLISRSIWKTGREYYYEMKNTNLKDDFMSIIRQYEYIWFGKFKVTEPEFEIVKGDFNHFFDKLNNLN